MRFRSTKTYGHEVGLSCAFRQWRADSHCRLIHGYALSVRIEFGADELDERNWVVDFGGLAEVKEMLVATFDHKLLVAIDDPNIDDLTYLEQLGLAQVIVMERVGCEAFAEHVWMQVALWLRRAYPTGRVKVVSVEVKEHGANSAIYHGG